MKTIQAIRATKNVEVGQIKRVNDKDADSEVKGGYWKYIPKSEWKSGNKKPKENENNSTKVENSNKENKNEKKYTKNTK